MPELNYITTPDETFCVGDAILLNIESLSALDAATFELSGDVDELRIDVDAISGDYVSYLDQSPLAKSDADKLQARINIGIPVNNFSAIIPPTVTDDSASNYNVGSLWIDTVAKEAYRCTDATVGAAVWIESTLDAAEVQALIDASIALLYIP